MAEVVQHHGLLVNLHVNLPGDGLQRAYRVADHVELLVLALEHLLLHRHLLAHEPVRRTVHHPATTRTTTAAAASSTVARTVQRVLQLGILRSAVPEPGAAHVHDSSAAAICVVQVVDMNGMAEAGTVVQQGLSGCDVAVPYPVQAHLLLHRLDLIAGRLDERAPRRQLALVDLKLGRVLLDDSCWGENNVFSVKGKLNSGSGSNRNSKVQVSRTSGCDFRRVLKGR